ncbi:MAG: glycogen-binding domain-containing protein [Desulfobulbaceae bacterium]|nr:glycogen-binding domain-containing protein [Desulfobulbaceae bacterium]
MNYYISMYIDNELSLDEKIQFINLVHDDTAYKKEAVSFVEQEKLLAGALNKEAPASGPFSPKIRYFPSVRQAAVMAAAACLLVFTAFLFGKNYPYSLPVTPEIASIQQHRFVIYHQGSSTVEIIGSFTDWQRIPLHPAGSNGYWEISLDVPPGEHRYSYILDNENILPDPTVSAREEDDFGSINSILSVEA